jgi:putative glutamine amidotransferase
MIASQPPVIGIPCCARQIGDHPFHICGDKYVRAVFEAAGGLPLLVPALGAALDPAIVLAQFDGLLITGSPSNVEPHHYDGAASAEGTLHDAARDATTLPLLRAAIAADLPVLAICRGIQELNVALGGSLHQRLHELPGRRDHREPKGGLDAQYAHAAHPVRLSAAGLFAQLNGGSETLMVNSLHSQGIDRLAAGLVVEATAPDGQIEAVRGIDRSFLIGVQWHPEYRALENPFSRALFAAFGAACRARAARPSRVA